MTKEKLIEKFDEKFNWIEEYIDDKPEFDHYADIKQFLLESINEILDEVCPKEETSVNGCTYGDTDYENTVVVYGYNKAIADLKDNRKKMGYEK